MTYEPGIDVVVVNYKTPQLLDEFCQSFEQFQPKIPWTLAIMNVEPHQVDLDVGEKWAKQLSAFHGAYHKNVGYAHACNQGAALGEKEALVLFNADVRLLSPSIDGCHQALMDNPSWGILGPKQINLEGRITHAGIFGTHQAPQHRGWQAPDGSHYADVCSAITVSGSAFFVKRECWDQLTTCETYQAVAPDAEGAFLPTKLFYEETFAAYHAYSHKWDVMYLGTETMIHHWHASSPVGGYAEQQFAQSRDEFRRACDAHGIDHD